eukprot:PhF_6_TR7997/c1_g1_i1/m.12317
MLGTNSDIIMLQHHSGHSISQQLLLESRYCATISSAFIYSDFLLRFVEPAVASQANASMDDTSFQTLFKFAEGWLCFDVPSRLMLLGGGGMGKTTSTLALMGWLLSSSNTTHQTRERKLFPILVTLPSVQRLLEKNAIDEH